MSRKALLLAVTVGICVLVATTFTTKVQGGGKQAASRRTWIDRPLSAEQQGLASR